MSRIIVIREGPTEQSFCNDVLQYYFSPKGIYLQNPVIKKNGGGIVNWAALKRQIENHLLEDKTATVTTLIDYYGIYSHHAFPGWDEAEKKLNMNERLEYLETAMFNDIQEPLRQRFIPYIQLHEFEALLFSDVAIIKQQVSEEDLSDYKALVQIANAYPNPELINNDRNTAPSKRLAKLIVGYRKTVHGPIIAEAIGLPAIRAKCPRFDTWITKLENI